MLIEYLHVPKQTILGTISVTQPIDVVGQLNLANKNNGTYVARPPTTVRATFNNSIAATTTTTIWTPSVNFIAVATKITITASAAQLSQILYNGVLQLEFVPQINIVQVFDFLPDGLSGYVTNGVWAIRNTSGAPITYIASFFGFEI